MMDGLFSPASVASRGTFFHSKEFFGHKSVQKDVMHNFQHVWDLMQVQDFTDDSSASQNIMYYRSTSFTLLKREFVTYYSLKVGVERAASPWPTLGIRSCRTFCSDLA